MPLMLSCAAPRTPQPAPDQPPASLARFVKDFEAIDGFFNMYWDNNEGKLWMKVDRVNEEFLYVNSLVTGIGSNDIGLDRGQFGRERVVTFIRNGPTLFLMQPNYNFRAISENPAEAKAVREAFAQSVLGSFPIEKVALDGYLVDVTDFFLEDAHGIGRTLKRTDQGNYSINKKSSSILRDKLKNFPQNTVIEALLTFQGESGGRFVREVVPSPEYITVVQRHSFIALPGDGYTMRRFDARAGYFGLSYYDYATSFDEPLEQRFIVRHRLQKAAPNAPISKPVKPIIYYLDPGVPEPVRSALLEGAGWWNEAFKAAGYEDAFRIKMLPEDADMMDVRYNIIQWVHRSTRGWSYGRSVVDPRTGEIIKGHVSLGSLRVRQDFLIAQGLLSPYDGDEDKVIQAREMALARIRQLAAHEVGHTLGLAHNYASSVNDRASVMDYPHPMISLDNKGEIDLFNAYGTGIGEWDKIAISYGYSEINDGQETEEVLNGILREAINAGLYYISDRDARPRGSAHPYAHLWDNRLNAADELNRMIAIRKKALSDFGVNTIPENQPYATLENVLVTVYLLHRYQLEAASKLIGGLNYTYAYRGDGQIVTAMVPAEMQRMALDAVLRTIRPDFLMIPEPILQLIPPAAPGFYDTREQMKKKTGLTFDPLTAAESAADLTLSLLFHPERASRLVEYHARDPEIPGLAQLLEEIIENTWKKTYPDAYSDEINRTVSKLVLSHMIRLADDPQAAGQAKAIALTGILDLQNWLQKSSSIREPQQKAHFLYGLERIAKFRNKPDSFAVPETEELPMGPPIGTGFLNCDF